MSPVKPSRARIAKRWAAPFCLVLLVLLAATGCAGPSPSSDAGASAKAAPASSGVNAAKDSNACHLLAPDEVSALVEKKIMTRDQTEAGDIWSTCQWEDEGGTPLFTLTVYWANGKQEWDTWRTAQGLGNQLLKQAEGVRPDGVVNQGPVSGIGDGAYFSGLLPSLVLKGDILFEMNLFFVPHAETKFAGLARDLLAKIN